VTELPVVSCLMTAYNHERWIVEAIESALVQARDYPADRLDIVLVDDGSTDATPELVEPYRDRLRYIRKPNGGVLSTVNRALEEARGELFCFLSGDDLWLPGKIRSQVEVMVSRPDVSLVYGDMRLIDGDGALQHPSYYALHGLPHPEGDVRGPLLSRQIIAAASPMLRLSLRARIFPVGPPAVWEDWWMYHHAARAGQAVFIPRADVCYRQHGDNMCAGITGEKRTNFIRRELPYRRWLLAESDIDGIGVDHVLAALTEFEGQAALTAQATGEPLETLVPVSAVEHERAADAVRAAEEAATAGAFATAAIALMRALAWDPWNSEARATLPGMLHLAREPQAPAGVRGTVIVADARELVDRPQLLGAYAAAFAADDDVTLVIEARGWSAERVERELVPLAGDHGLSDDGPDVLVLSDDRPWPRERLAAVLSLESERPLPAPCAATTEDLRHSVAGCMAARAA
jgi:hypothetical protein